MPLPKANGCKPEIEMLTYTLIWKLGDISDAAYCTLTLQGTVRYFLVTTSASFDLLVPGYDMIIAWIFL